MVEATTVAIVNGLRLVMKPDAAALMQLEQRLRALRKVRPGRPHDEEE